MSLRQLKWMVVVAPAMFLVIVTLLLRGPAHEELHNFPGYLYVLGALTTTVVVFSLFVFAILARVERSILEQNDELQRRNRELAALLAFGQTTNASVSLDGVLEAALELIVPLVSAEAGEVWLADEAGGLTLARTVGVEPDLSREPAHMCPGTGLAGLAARGGRPIVLDGGDFDPTLVRRGVTALDHASYCALPLTRKGETVGVLVLGGRVRQALAGPRELRLLEAIGEQLATEIENARLHERVLDGAVIEERERLARELHDGLAQVLGYVNTQTLAIKRLLETGRNVEARMQLAAMEDAARDVYADVRGAILGLRTPQSGLLAGLHGCCSDHERLSGVAVTLEVGDGVASTRLPAPVEIQLTRIVQEALGNVRKHAPGVSPTVSLDVTGGALTVEIEDRGPGFEPGRPRRTGWPHFGLQTMRERAEAIGGTFAVESTPGAGTRIVVRVPVAGRTEVRHASAAR